MAPLQFNGEWGTKFSSYNPRVPRTYSRETRFIAPVAWALAGFGDVVKPREGPTGVALLASSPISN